MANKKVPFYAKQIECPVCRNFSNNFVFKSKVVVPSKVDTDNYVISYHWLDKGYKQCLPSFYALWVCTTCGYADFPESFEKLLKDSSDGFAQFKNAVLKGTSSKEGLLFKLLSKILFSEEEGLEFETAMNIHLLALYCNDVLAGDNHDFEKLGRLYLRTSWLHRDFKSLNIAERPFAEYPSYWDYVRSLQPLWSEIPVDEKSSLEKAALYYSKIIDQEFNYEEAVRNVRQIFLAAELYLRLNNFERALTIVHSVVQLGINLRSEIMRSMDMKRSEDDLSRSEERYLRSKIDKISDELTGIHDKYFEIQQKWVRFYAARIDEVCAAHKTSPRDVLVAKLEEKGIPQKVIRILQNRDPRFQNEKKKSKHFWEFWKQ